MELGYHVLLNMTDRNPIMQRSASLAYCGGWQQGRLVDSAESCSGSIDRRNRVIQLW